MLNELRRWLGGRSQRPQQMAAMSRWVERAGHAFKPVREGAGCVIEGKAGGRTWRAEWGESQRAYIASPELRLIAEPGVPRDLQIVVMNRELAEAIERAMFEQAVDDVQTRIDADIPTETRWLVMYPKLGAAEMGELRTRYVALGNAPRLIAQWLASPLGEALAETLPRVASTDPVVLAVGRGRLTLRTPMAAPDADRLAMWLEVFQSALAQIVPLGQAWQDADRSSRPDIWRATQASGQPSTLSEASDDPASR